MRTDHLSSRCALDRFRRDEDGVAAVEFAMIVPALVTLYLGCVDLTMGYTIYRKVLHATSVMSDLVTRTNSVTKSDLDAIFDIGDASVAPRASGLDSAKISAITVDAAGKAKVSWSRARNMTADPVGTLITLPSDMSSLRSTNLIRTIAGYSYQPPGASQVIGTIPFQKELYNVPRTGTNVTCSNC